MEFRFFQKFTDVRTFTNHPPPLPGMSEISKPPPLPICRTSFVDGPLGDFNFPNIDWSSVNCNPSHGREQQLAGEAILSFIDHNMLHQVVNTPTRDRNILELFLTNNERLIRNVAAQDTPLSNHRVVFINLLTDLKYQSPPSPIPTFEDHTFRSLNIHKADFIKMNSILSEIDRDLLRDQCHADPDGNLFT